MRQGDAQVAQSAVHWVVSECRIWRKGCPPHTMRVDAGSGKLWMGGGARDVGTRMVRIQTQTNWDAGTGMVWVQAEGCTRIWAVFWMQAAGWLGFRHRDAQDAQMHGEWSPWAPGCKTGAWSCPPAQPILLASLRLSPSSAHLFYPLSPPAMSVN